MGVFKDILKALARAILYALFTWMVNKGWITKEQADSWIDPAVLQVIGWLGLAAVYLWSVRDKIKSWVFGILARKAPANTPPEAIKAEIKAMSIAEEVSTALTAAPPEGAPTTKE